MKKRTIRERISYWFDCMMSKGTVAMCILLFGITMLMVGVVGVVSYFVADEGGVLFQMWTSLMCAIDGGTIAGMPTDNVPYLVFMGVATLCGLFITSILIGIITTGVEDKLSELRKGISAVQEDGHTVIIGFDNNVYDILRELIEANSNKKKACVVILGEESKEEMEDAIASHVSNTRTTTIICRSGKLYEACALERCSVETSKSVIVNVHDDAETVKVLLALTAYLREKELLFPEMRIVAAIEEKQYLEAAEIAGEGRAAIIYAKDAIARIIANTCRQHGLSQVLMELFNFDGNEMYFENVPELIGRTFKEAVLSFSNAIVVGIYKDGNVVLNPAMDMVITEATWLVILEEDDGSYKLKVDAEIDESKIYDGTKAYVDINNSMVVLGTNDKLPIILSEYDKYVEPGTDVVIVDDDFDESRLDDYDNLEIKVCTETVTKEMLYKLLEGDVDNILLLNDDSQDPETSDSMTLLRLILLRDIADKTDRNFLITTEMRNVDNQRLASQARVDDFVIGSNFTSILMSQLSENPKLLSLVQELLDDSGSELYMKPAAAYVTIGENVNSYTIAESVARKGEIYIGYRLMGEDVVVNPNKDEVVVFGEKDQLAVIAKQ